MRSATVIREDLGENYDQNSDHNVATTPSEFDFTQLSLVTPLADLAASLTEPRAMLRTGPAIDYLRGRIHWRKLSVPTFYDWRDLACVQGRALYTSTALLYMEIIALHLRLWNSRSQASKAIQELLKWQDHLYRNFGQDYDDTAFALGCKLQETGKLSLAAGQVEAMIYSTHKEEQVQNG